eukprot:3664911-Karenia_brevis.AAC.1
MYIAINLCPDPGCRTMHWRLEFTLQRAAFGTTGCAKNYIHGILEMRRGAPYVLHCCSTEDDSFS